MDADQMRKECEEWIRSGQAPRARKTLLKLNFGQIPRAQLHTFCALSRRSGLWQVSLRALKPFVRPKTKHSAQATSIEKIEYALSLRRAGAYAESEKLLLDPGLERENKALMARGFGKMYLWEYEEAAPLLEKFIADVGAAEYDLLTAKVNLLACYNYTASPKFEPLFEELEPALTSKKLFLLLANCLETRAQFLIERERWDDAGRVLNQAQKLLADEDGRHTLYINKWQRILKALHKKSLSDIENFRGEALAARDWETLRDLDYFQTRLKPECGPASRVFFGTPYASFRKRLEKIRSYPDQHWLESGKVTKEFDPWFPGTNEGDIPHRLLVFLLRDLYRPVSIGEIFSSIHENEYFDIDSSVIRVRQMVKRLREWLAKSKLPVAVDILDGLYSARPAAGSRILLRARTLPLDKTKFIFERYRGLAEAPQLAADWARVLGVSSANVSRILRAGVDGGLLSRSGAGRYTRYAVT